MGVAAIPLQRWPADRGRLAFVDDLAIVALETPPGTDRTAARRIGRQALQEILAAHLECLPGQVTLVSRAGEPLRLEGFDPAIGLSLSHEPGLSLAAIHLKGAIGVDLMALSDAPVWQAEIPRLAADYLGPEIAREIAGLPPQVRPRAFAGYWTGLEARLKCLGLALGEWTPSQQRKFDALHCTAVELPPGWVGNVAVSRACR